MQTAVAKRRTGRVTLGLKRTLLSSHLLLLGGLVAAGFLLRLMLLADKSIWLDEAFSIAISQRNPIDVVRMVILTDTHPPLYYLILNLWLELGTGEGQVRLLSVLFSAASIAMIYKLAGALYEDPRAGVLAAAILAFSPFQIWYAQEARMYAMLTFLLLASAYFFIMALRRRSTLDWVAFVVATTLALYTDNGALWFVLAIGIFYLLSIKRFPGTRLGWTLSQVGVGLLYAPWLPFLWRQTRQVSENFWLPPPAFQTVLGTFLDFNSLNFPWIGLSVLYMSVIFVFAYIVPDRKGWQRPLLTLWLFAPLGVSLLLSLRQPIFLSRNLIAASLGYYLLITGIILKFRSQKAAIVLLLPLVAMNLVSIGHNLWSERKEDWRAAAAYVAHEARATEAGLLFFVPSYAELPFQYYFQQYGLPLETQGFPEDEILLHAQPRQVDDVAATLEGRPVVWLILRDVEAVDPDWTVKVWLDSHGYERAGDLVSDDLTVIKYVRWDHLMETLPPSSTDTASKEEGGTCLTGPNQAACDPTTDQDSEDTGSEREVRVHIVRDGESLSQIALRYGTTIVALAKANAIEDPNKIYLGQELIIP